MKTCGGTLGELTYDASGDTLKTVNGKRNTCINTEVREISRVKLYYGGLQSYIQTSFTERLVNYSRNNTMCLFSILYGF